jgi:hypothetical protein
VKGWDRVWKWSRGRSWPVWTRPPTQQSPLRWDFLLRDYPKGVESKKKRRNMNRMCHLRVSFPCITKYIAFYIDFVENADVRDSDTANRGQWHHGHWYKICQIVYVGRIE